jgi:hypothetical protein
VYILRLSVADSARRSRALRPTAILIDVRVGSN